MPSWVVTSLIISLSLGDAVSARLDKSAKLVASPWESAVNSLTDLATDALFWAMTGCASKLAANNDADKIRIVGIEIESLGLNVGELYTGSVVSPPRMHKKSETASECGRLGRQRDIACQSGGIR